MAGFRSAPAAGRATADPGQRSLPIPWTLAATDECSDWERETHAKSWNLAMLKALRRWSHNGTGLRTGGQQPSGDGSSIWATTPVRKFLRYVFDYLKIRTFLDVPCGDMTWMPEVDLRGVEYFGGDLSSALVASHLQRFAGDRRFANKFARFDITCMIPPRVDLIHARDVFMHIDTDLSLRAIRNFEGSGSKYLVVPHWPFSDGSSNEYHPANFELAYQNVHNLNPKASQVIGYHHYNLELPPYCFPAPLYWIRNSAIAERNGWLGVWALPALGRGQHSKCIAHTAWFDTICHSRFNCFDTQEERRDCLAGNSRSESPCCTALHLIQRLHRLDTGAMWFVEPQEVQSLCSDFVRLPTGSLVLEEQMTMCSRAVLALAEFAYETHDGEGTNLQTNESCSTVSVHARYPLLAEEDQVLSEQHQKQRVQWFDRAYRIHTHLGSGWSYQLNGRKLLMSLANHTAACDELEQGCALFNPWEPKRCFAHHPLVKSWSPSCSRRPQIPGRPLREVAGPVRDWLGLRQDCGHSESEGSRSIPQIRPDTSVTRALECAGLPWGPVAGEDYFETISLLAAVEDAVDLHENTTHMLIGAEGFISLVVFIMKLMLAILVLVMAVMMVMLMLALMVADLDEVATECSKVPGVGKVQTFPVDLSDREGVDSLASFVDSCGGCDVLVNNAGRVSPGSASEGDVDDWDKMIYLNLNGVMRLTRRLIPNMAAKKWGALINLGSIAAIEGMSGSQAAYAATKHGLRGWNHSIYQGLRHDNIKVMLINPAFVNTPLVTGMGNDKLLPERMIQPEDVAEVCLLPFRMSPGCVPSEVTLRLTLSAFKS
ncbi:yoxD [Symbiodinium sp. CCMP2592]|nr:yoxD [Symbiodinium sp. CCMP2592]